MDLPPLSAPIPRPAVPTDWESTLGGNWFNKVGVVVLVCGLAWLLQYSFAHIGPLGRVAISLAVSLAMLAAGVVFEPRERYRIFARGLLGGGWAGLYTTVYAMHAVPGALVIPDPVLGTVLLIAVATGMIAHSLRYRSQAVTGLAYFIAFGTLAIAETNTLAVVALIPLAVSLLYIVHRFAWTRTALLGLVATYSVIVLRGDHGTPLAPAQALFAIFWLVFEAFDILHPEAWLLPLNAAGFLGLSLMKWNSDAPESRLDAARGHCRRLPGKRGVALAFRQVANGRHPGLGIGCRGDLPEAGSSMGGSGAAGRSGARLPGGSAPPRLAICAGWAPAYSPSRWAGCSWSI